MQRNETSGKILPQHFCCAGINEQIVLLLLDTLVNMLTFFIEFSVLSKLYKPDRHCLISERNETS